MRLVNFVFFTTLICLFYQKSYADCETLFFKNLDDLKLVSENTFEDKSRQIVWGNKNIAISIIQYHKQSYSKDELETLSKSVVYQLSNITRNKNIKFLNPDKNVEYHPRLYRLFFAVSLKEPKSLEIAGIFSDSGCTEIIRFTEINPISDSQSLDTSRRLMYRILSLKI